MSNATTETGECEAFSDGEPTKPIGNEDIVTRDIRNLGLEFSALAQLCAESARSLDSAHRAERLFVVRLLYRALDRSLDGIRERREFYREIVGE